MYHALLGQPEKMEGELGAALDDGTDGTTGAWIGFATEAMAIDDDAGRETAQEWMRDNLLNLRAVLTPYLEAVAAQDE